MKSASSFRLLFQALAAVVIFIMPAPQATAAKDKPIGVVLYKDKPTSRTALAVEYTYLENVFGGGDFTLTNGARFRLMNKQVVALVLYPTTQSVAKTGPGLEADRLRKIQTAYPQTTAFLQPWVTMLSKHQQAAQDGEQQSQNAAKQAVNITTKDGRIFTRCTLLRIEKQKAVVQNDTGVTQLPLSDLDGTAGDALNGTNDKWFIGPPAWGTLGDHPVLVTGTGRKFINPAVEFRDSVFTVNSGNQGAEHKIPLAEMPAEGMPKSVAAKLEAWRAELAETESGCQKNLNSLQSKLVAATMKQTKKWADLMASHKGSEILLLHAVVRGQLSEGFENLVEKYGSQIYEIRRSDTNNPAILVTDETVYTSTGYTYIAVIVADKVKVNFISGFSGTIQLYKEISGEQKAAVRECIDAKNEEERLAGEAKEKEKELAGIKETLALRLLGEKS